MLHRAKWYWQSFSGHQLCYLIKARSRCRLIAFSLHMDFKDAPCGQKTMIHLILWHLRWLMGSNDANISYFLWRLMLWKWAEDTMCFPSLPSSAQLMVLRPWSRQAVLFCLSLDCRCCLLLILTKYTMDPCENTLSRLLTVRDYVDGQKFDSKWKLS